VRPARRLQPKDARARLKVSFAIESRHGRQDGDVSQHDLALELGVDKSLVGRSESDASPETPSALMLASAAYSKLAAPWALRMIRRVAAEHGASVEPTIHDLFGNDNAARLASVATETTDPVRAFAVALADGDLSAAELLDIERQCDEGIDSLRELRASAQRARLALQRDRHGE
jgi:transcriptional regulator with XRE-family HTH domain